MKTEKLTVAHKNLNVAGLLDLLGEADQNTSAAAGRMEVERPNGLSSKSSRVAFRANRAYGFAVEKELTRRLGLASYPGREELVKLAKASL